MSLGVLSSLRGTLVTDSGPTRLQSGLVLTNQILEALFPNKVLF